MIEKRKLSAIILLLVVLCGCHSNQLFEQCIADADDSSVSLYNVLEDEHYYVKKMAQYLSVATKNHDFVSLLAEEANQKIDGDYDILVAKSFNIGERSDSKLLNSFLSSLPNTVVAKEAGEAHIFSFLRAAQKYSPLLNIYFPQDVEEKWLHTDEFLTIILEPSFSDTTDSIVYAYNQRGEQIVLSVDEEPLVPYIVVGINERISFSPDSTLARSINEPIFKNEYYSFYLPEYFNNEMKIVETLYNNYRGERSNPDVISRARFKSSDAIKAVEKWLRGAPEVHLTVIYADYSPADIIMGPLLHNLQFNLGDNNWYKGKRRKKRPCDNYGNWSITSWTNCQKSYMKYHFHEMDNKFKVSINGWDVQFSGGDLIGDSKVNYSDVLGTTYHIGNMFEFDIR